MQIICVEEIPHGGDMYVDQQPDEEVTVWLSTTCPEAQSEALIRFLEQLE